MTDKSKCYGSPREIWGAAAVMWENRAVKDWRQDRLRRLSLTKLTPDPKETEQNQPKEKGPGEEKDSCILKC